jgi:hypothetical protein
MLNYLTDKMPLKNFIQKQAYKGIYPLYKVENCILTV